MILIFQSLSLLTCKMAIRTRALCFETHRDNARGEAMATLVDINTSGTSVLLLPLACLASQTWDLGFAKSYLAVD